MKKRFTFDWFYAACIRAIKTFAQTFGAMIVVGASLQDIDWLGIASVASVAAILSIITSIGGLPETKTDGAMLIDTSNPSKDTYSLIIDTDLAKLPEQSILRLKVDPTAVVPPPSQE